MPLTVQDFDNADLDLDTISEVINSDEVKNVTSRLGTVISTLVKAIQSVGFYPEIIAWQPSTEYNDFQQLVENGGLTYKLKIAHTSSSNFQDDVDNWLLYENSGGGSGDIPTTTDLDNTNDGFFYYSDSANNAPIPGIAGGGYQISNDGASGQVQYVHASGLRYMRWRGVGDWSVWLIDNVTFNDLTYSEYTPTNMDNITQAGSYILNYDNAGTFPDEYAGAVQPYVTLKVISGNIYDETDGTVNPNIEAQTTQILFAFANAPAGSSGTVRRIWVRGRSEYDAAPAYGQWRLLTENGDWGLGGAAIDTNANLAGDYSGYYICSSNVPNFGEDFLVHTVNELADESVDSGSWQLAVKADGSEDKLWFRYWIKATDQWSTWREVGGGGGSATQDQVDMSKNNLNAEALDLISANQWQKVEKASGGGTIFDNTVNVVNCISDLANSTFQVNNAGTYKLNMKAEIALDAPLSDIVLSVDAFTGTEPTTPAPERSDLIGFGVADNASQYYQLNVQGKIDLVAGEKLIPIITSNATTNPTVRGFFWELIRIA